MDPTKLRVLSGYSLKGGHAPPARIGLAFPGSICVTDSSGEKAKTHATPTLCGLRRERSLLIGKGSIHNASISDYIIPPKISQRRLCSGEVGDTHPIRADLFVSFLVYPCGASGSQMRSTSSLLHNQILLI
jgi:hypothetical protein